jgi:hypothetical protein
MEDDDAVAERLDVREDVARDEDRVIAAELTDQPARLGALRGIEPHRRLVEEERRRIADEPGREVHALAHPARQRADAAAAHVA